MKTLALLLCLLPMGAFGQNHVSPKAQSNPPAEIQPKASQAPLPEDPRDWAYGMRSFARAAGNIGGWWSFLSENEKSAFLDGYQSAMAQALTHNTNLCKVLRDGIKTSSDQEAFMNQMVIVINICDSGKDFSGFDKVTIKDLDEFYSAPVNQPMLLEWSMPYLRDKATGRKTKGELLDALEAEQKDVHDCTKYPGLCKLGTGSK